MMLKTSSRKLNPCKNMIGFTLRKSIGFIIILCIAALLYCPGGFIVNFEDLKAANIEDLASSYKSNNNQLVEHLAYLVTVMSAIIGILFNAINFSFLYKKSSSDVFHAFPLTRTQLLLSRFSAGLIATFIPVIVCYAAFAIMAAFNPWMGSLTQLAVYLLYTVIITLVCSSFSLIFIISAGSMFDMGVSLIGSNIALLLVGQVFDSVLDRTLLGYNRAFASDIIYWISPPYFCGIGLGRANNGMNGRTIEFFIRSVIYIIAFTAIAVLLYNKRRAEKCEQGYAYKFMYIFCGALAGICGGYLIGFLFTYDVSSPVFYIFMTIGAILTAVIYGVITNRGFKNFGRAIAVGCVSSLIIISVAVFGITGGLGYSKRIPEKQDISDTHINAFSEFIHFENPDDILALHHKIIETGAASDDEYAEGKINVSFEYTLKNGKTMSRSFLVDTALLENELLTIYKSDERMNSIKESINFDKSASFSLYFYDNGKYVNAIITQAEAKEFLDAYRLDVQNCSSEVLNNRFEDYYEISGYTQANDTSFDIRLEAKYEEFSNTRRFIEENGIIQRAE